MNYDTGALGPSAKPLLWRVTSCDDAPVIRSARYRHDICRLSVVLMKASRSPQAGQTWVPSLLS